MTDASGWVAWAKPQACPGVFRLVLARNQRRQYLILAFAGEGAAPAMQWEEASALAVFAFGFLFGGLANVPFGEVPGSNRGRSLYIKI